MSSFTESPEATLAFDLAGGEGAPDEVFETLIRVMDDDRLRTVAHWLAERGLRYCTIVELVGTVRLHESDADNETRHKGGTIVSNEARRAVLYLYTRGVPADVISRLLDLEQERVETFLANRHTKLPEPEIMRLHVQGLTPLEISKQVDHTRQAIEQVIRRHGETPHTKIKRLSEDQKRRIIIQRRNGMTPKQIQELNPGLEIGQIKNAIRVAGAAGLIPGYGEGVK